MSVQEKIRKDPEDIPSLTQLIWRGVYKGLRRIPELPVWVQIVVIVTIALLALTCVRRGVFGEKVEEISKRIIPVGGIPFIDSDRPDIRIDFSFQVESKSGSTRQQGRVGGTYRSGDRIRLYINTNTECWLSVLGIDIKGIHGVGVYTPRRKEPERFSPQNEPKIIPFDLDDTKGIEVYYAVASHKKFDFEKDIEPKLQQILSGLKENSGKGPVFPASEYRIPLGKDYYQDVICFEHR